MMLRMSMIGAVVMGGGIAGMGCGDNLSPAFSPGPCGDLSQVRLDVLRGGPATDAFVRVRTDGSDWYEPELVSAGDYSLEYAVCSARTYSTFVACTDDTAMPARRLVEASNATPAEAIRRIAYCGWEGGDPGERVLVEGRMAQAGEVSIGLASGFSNANNWGFSIPVPAGIHDVVASTASRIAIRRAVNIDGPIQLAPIDVEQEGRALITRDFTLPDTSGSTSVMAEARLSTISGTYSSIGHANVPQLRVPPADLLVAGDAIQYVVRAFDDDDAGWGYRYVSGPYRDDLSQVVLPPRLDPAIVPRGTARTVSLAVLPVLADAWPVLTFNDLDAESSVRSSPGWLATTQATELGFDVPAEFAPEALASGLGSRDVALSAGTGPRSGFLTSISVSGVGVTQTLAGPR